MPTKIEATCPQGHTATITIDMNITNLNVGGQIKVDDLCPICGGTFTAPGGHYEKDENDVMVRKGDFTP